MDLRKLKIGIIGCGRWGMTHLKVLSRMVKKEQLFMSDTDKKKLSQGSLSVNRTYHDYKRMIKENQLNCVFVVSSTIHHYTIARYCLEQGLDVFIEKPMTVKSSQAFELVTLSRGKKRLLVPGHIFLYKKAFERIRSEFNRDEKHNLFIMKRLNNGPAILDEGVIFDLAVHDIYMCLHLLGSSPVSVFAKGVFKNKALVGASIILTFKNALVTILSGWLGLGSARGVHILNGNKEFIWEDIDPPSLVIKKSLKKKKRTFQNKRIDLEGPCAAQDVISSFTENALMEEDRLFLQSCLTRRSFVKPEEGYMTVRIMEMISKSLKSSREVTL
ncbi:MAG: Gfo/Idh/MocA family oxidoreductase [Spirochaetes bacterium]|nr:Gfo/Idh/MocA family oxidoreductase [Spirochaetota bacterium]